MWLAEVKAKAKRKNQILFSKDSLLLTDLCQLIAQANRRALILWALELAEETARELAEKYSEDHRPLDAIAASRAWASGEIKMPIAKQAIPPQASLDLERDNFLSFYFFLNVSHPNHPFGGQRTKTADPVDFFVDPKTQKLPKVRKTPHFEVKWGVFWWR